jgi:hypothetical protein
VRAGRGGELIPDVELESLCAPTPWEQWLQRFGCVLGLALALALAVVTWLHGEDVPVSRLVAVPVAGLVGGLPGILVFVYFLRLYGRRRDPRVVERDRRLGRAALHEYGDDARETLRAAGAPDWIVLLAAQALPMGDTHWVRVALTAGAGNVEVRTTALTTAGEKSETRTGTLLPDEAAELSRLLATLAGDDPAARRRRLDTPGVLDGFPVRAAILRRAPAWDTAFDFNLAGVPEGEAHPAVALARAVLGVEERVAGSGHVAGFRDASGDVRVGPV